MFMDKFLLIVFSVAVQPSTAVAARDPGPVTLITLATPPSALGSTLKKYAAKCRKILDLSDPFDRLDKLRENFTEDFFKNTGEIAEMLKNGQLGKIANTTGVGIDEAVWWRGHKLRPYEPTRDEGLGPWAGSRGRGWGEVGERGRAPRTGLSHESSYISRLFTSICRVVAC